MDKSKAVNLTKLSQAQIAVVRDKATETPYTGQLLNNTKKGTYSCAACGNIVFDSTSKFDSGSGWPSFDKAVPGSIKQLPDTSHGMIRTEVICANCGAHLGHVFDDVPKVPTGQYYCINSLALDFKPHK